MKRLKLSIGAAALALGLLVMSTPVQGQDLTTLLAFFLRDLYAGVLGVTTPIRGVLVTQAALTADAQALSTTATWNNAGVTFVHWKAVITDTASAAGSLPIQILGGAAGSTSLFTLSKTGLGTFAGSVFSTGGGFVAASTSSIGFNNTTLIQSATNGLLNVTNNGSTSGIQDTFGADVTVTSCGTGSVTAGSKNVAGNITATGATACTVTFASPTFTNKPFCVVSPETGAVPTVIVNTTVSFTVTALTSGAAFNYLCRGRI